ncbi:carbohydrate ABC transporter permease [Streptomyces sp. NPDC004610]|uniref:carbohydrate ABC transporter permease n=1 Tax=unclassified Streptomyces TaxID=2593676 RepID=UPI0033A6F93E
MTTSPLTHPAGDSAPPGPARPVPPPPRRPADPARHRRTRRSRGTFRILGVPAVWIWACFNVFLLLWVVMTAFRNGSEIFTDPFRLPDSLSPANFTDAWSVSDLGSGFLNSAVVVTAASLTVIALSAPAAYVLARGRQRSGELVTLLFILGMGIPMQAVIIPVFVWMQNISTFMYAALGWWDERISLYLIYVASSLPFTVFLLTGFFRTLPGELEEAAALDGCTGLRAFRSIMLPLARPGITTALILLVVSLWNETLLALVLITETEKYTLPQALLGLYGTMQYTSHWGGLFAGIVIVVVPILALYIWLGRRIVEGLTLGVGK